MMGLTFTSWNAVIAMLQTKPHGSVLRIAKHLLPHPTVSGAVVSTGLPVGQSADYRLPLPDCTGLHIHDFVTHYEAHVDKVDPSCGIVEHLRADAPGTYVAGATALGALLGMLLGRSKGAALAGAGLGALVGALTLPEPTKQRRLPAHSAGDRPTARGQGRRLHRA